MGRRPVDYGGEGRAGTWSRGLWVDPGGVSRRGARDLGVLRLGPSPDGPRVRRDHPDHPPVPLPVYPNRSSGEDGVGGLGVGRGDRRVENSCHGRRQVPRRRHTVRDRILGTQKS